MTDPRRPCHCVDVERPSWIVAGVMSALWAAACGTSGARPGDPGGMATNETSSGSPTGESSSRQTRDSSTSGATGSGPASGSTFASGSHSGTTSITRSTASASMTGSTESSTTATSRSSNQVGSSASTGSSTSSGFDPCPASGDCKILPLGDSITWGSTTNNGGYRVELFSQAIQNGKHVTFVGSQLDGPSTVAGAPFPRNNEGHPGWTISQIAGIATLSNALKDTPPIVLLHIGTNDLPNSLSGASDRLAQLVDQIIAALPDSLLVVAQIIPLPWAESSVVTYNAAIPAIVQQRAAQGKHVLLVDMNTGFPSTSGYASDNIHPNDAVGYPWMGDRWYAAITPYLH